MIIVHGSIVEKEKAEFAIKETKTGYTIKDGSDGTTFNFVTAKVAERPDIVHIAKSYKTGFAMIWHSELCHTRDALSSIAFRKGVQSSDLQQLRISIAVSEDGETALLVNGNVFVENANLDPVVVAREVNAVNATLLAKHFPGAAACVTYGKFKLDALAHFNPVDSISALEYQVDILSSAVIALIEKLPEEERPEGWEDFVLAVSENLSTAFRGRTKAIEEIRREKEKARKIQQDYFTELSNG
jgi:hypothetical protein